MFPLLAGIANLTELMPRTPLPTERGLLSQVVREVESRLPEGWDVVSVLEPAPSGPDALLTITAPDGAAAQFIIEAKFNLDPRSAFYALDQVRAYRELWTAGQANQRPELLI